MQTQWQLVRAGAAGYQLQQVDAPVRQPGAHEVLVRVRAVSLNRRDLLVLQGQYPVGLPGSFVPLSDGAGEVVKVGASVRRVRVGDRVVAAFFQSWISGPMTRAASAAALGGGIDGMLSPYVTLDEAGLVRIPAELSYAAAATLPCAGVTAWNALVTRGRTTAGQYVLLEGTGGVSVIGLQLAVALGARPIITSSSDAKLARARQLGAYGTVNYRSTPQWDQAVMRLTGGHGVQQVLEVGGRDTLPQALASLGQGGHLALIGGLSAFGGDIPAMALLGKGASVSSIYVGSRTDLEALLAFVARHRIQPVIDRAFSYQEAPAAYALMDSGQFFGKIVIRL
ncbi:MAG: NAD(P)-dependent alcohol dehydrogenase [Gammaproteobacteria bacterium]|nr:NAD(P)-dependent alcohol dehydrogenase [Gammaproteobacteria bacterium]